MKGKLPATRKTLANGNCHRHAHGTHSVAASATQIEAQRQAGEKVDKVSIEFITWSVNDSLSLAAVVDKTSMTRTDKTIETKENLRAAGEPLKKMQIFRLPRTARTHSLTFQHFFVWGLFLEFLELGGMQIFGRNLEYVARFLVRLEVTCVARSVYFGDQRSLNLIVSISLPLRACAQWIKSTGSFVYFFFVGWWVEVNAADTASLIE